MVALLPLLLPRCAPEVIVMEGTLGRYSLGCFKLEHSLSENKEGEVNNNNNNIVISIIIIIIILLLSSSLVYNMMMIIIIIIQM